NDNHSANFGVLLRGILPGVDPLAQDTLGRYHIKVGGTGFRPTGNIDGSFFYDIPNTIAFNNAGRFTGTVTTTYLPTDWATFGGTFGYDTRQSQTTGATKKGYRTETPNTNLQGGDMNITNSQNDALNGTLNAGFRKALTS